MKIHNKAEIPISSAYSRIQLRTAGNVCEILEIVDFQLQ